MASHDSDFELPEIPELAQGNYDEWNWAVHFHLDWFGLRQFIIGTDTEPSATASDEESLRTSGRRLWPRPSCARPSITTGGALSRGPDSTTSCMTRHTI
jgi:hypothetical protein